ncbi:hypothetical protein GCM10027578_21810 [Spirosoma luteolum]
MAKHMGEAIHKMAVELGFKAEDIAPAIGKTVGTVYGIYRRSSVDTDTLFTLSALFKKPIAAFFGDTYHVVAQGKSDSSQNHTDPGVIRDYQHEIEMLKLQIKHKDEMLSVYKQMSTRLPNV